MANDVTLHSSLASNVTSLGEEAARLIGTAIDHLSPSQQAVGISFLELKNHMLLNYMIDLSYLMLRKSFGKRIAQDPAIERLIEARTFLEKMRPIEKKLKYQMDKYIKIAENGGISSSDPLHFKPNLGALECSDEEDEDDGDEEAAAGSARKYVAPKHVSTFYRDDEYAEKESQEKAKKRLMSRGIVDELKRQHLDTPEEIHDRESFVQVRQMAEEKMRTRYEEENFLRLPVRKKDKHQQRQALLTVGRLGDHLTHDLGRSDFSENVASSSRMKRKKRPGFKNPRLKHKKR